MKSGTFLWSTKGVYVKSLDSLRYNFRDQIEVSKPASSYRSRCVCFDKINYDALEFSHDIF